MRPLGDLLSFYFLLAIARLVALLPIRWVRGIAWCLGRGAYALGLRRKMVRRNVDRCLPDLPPEERRRIARDCYVWFCWLTLDVLRSSRRPVEELRDRVEIRDADVIARGLEQEGGVVLTTVHAGNWELLAAGVVQAGFPFSVLVSEVRNPLLDAWLTKVRRRFGVQPIPRNLGARGLFKALRANRCVAMLFDQDARRSGIFANFFGIPASTFGGPAMYVLKTGAPLIFISGHYEGTKLIGKAQRLHYEPTGDRDADTLALMQLLNDTGESIIRQHPEQYFWHHNRFKTQPPEDGV